MCFNGLGLSGVKAARFSKLKKKKTKEKKTSEQNAPLCACSPAVSPQFH